MISSAQVAKPKGSAKGICNGYLEYRVVKLLETKTLNLKNNEIKIMASKKIIFGLIAGAVIAGVGYYFIKTGKRRTITTAPTNVEEETSPKVEEVVAGNETENTSDKKIDSSTEVGTVSSDLIREIENIEETNQAFERVMRDLVFIPKNRNNIKDIQDLLSVVAHKCILCFQFQPTYLEKIPKNEEQLTALLKITGTYELAKSYLQEIDRLERLSTKCEELNITQKVERKLKRKKFYPA